MTELEIQIRKAVDDRVKAERSGLIRDFGQANASLAKCRRMARDLDRVALDLALDNLMLLLLPVGNL